MMRKTYKIAAFCCLGVAVSTQSSVAQNQVIVANGGIFETMPAYADKATVGSYNLSTKTYTVFDTIQAESVNGTVIDRQYAYVGAERKLVKYNIDNHTRLATASTDKIKNVYVSGHQLFASFFDGATGALMQSFDTTTLSPIYAFTNLEKNVGGVVVMNDSIYIASNVKGTIDAFPPYGIYADTLGVISVFDAHTGVFARKIELGENGAGINQLVAYNNTINAVCKESGSVLEYNTLTGAATYTNIATTATWVDSYNNYLIVKTPNGIDHYDMDTKMLLNQAFTGSFAAAAYDYLNDEYYFTQTDYSSYGKTYIHDAMGLAIDSFEVEISPEAIAIDFRLNVSVKDEAAIVPPFSMYPNPAKTNIVVTLKDNAELLQIIDVTGRVVVEKKQLSKGKLPVNLRSLKSGVYFVKVRSNNQVTTAKMIKQ